MKFKYKLSKTNISLVPLVSENIHHMQQIKKQKHNSSRIDYSANNII
jgi:hypothetical protein